MSESGKSKGEQICDCCGESGARKKCKCKTRRYCGRECQRRDWEEHRYRVFKKEEELDLKLLALNISISS